SLSRTEDGMITIRICGNGFLYNMVRIIAGTLISVGMGQIPPDQNEDILNARDRAAAGPTAPARGLTLIGMEYEENAGKA
ncbi:tRNA pseudouridine(38-40) synthase TruA, partial [Bacillus cereus group sp. BC86]